VSLHERRQIQPNLAHIVRVSLHDSGVAVIIDAVGPEQTVVVRTNRKIFFHFVVHAMYARKAAGGYPNAHNFGAVVTDLTVRTFTIIGIMTQLMTRRDLFRVPTDSDDRFSGMKAADRAFMTASHLGNQPHVRGCLTNVEHFSAH